MASGEPEIELTQICNHLSFYLPSFVLWFETIARSNIAEINLKLRELERGVRRSMREREKGRGVA